jgi:hypothetical protein
MLAWVMLLAVLLAPATRLGYLLYPVNFFVWSWLLRSEETSSKALEAVGSEALVAENIEDEHLQRREPAACRRAGLTLDGLAPASSCTAHVGGQSWSDCWNKRIVNGVTPFVAAPAPAEGEKVSGITVTPTSHS